MGSSSRSTPSPRSSRVPDLGAALAALPTPSLLLDVERARHNAQRIGDRVKALGARLRPHVKTHKCIEVGRMQVEGQFGGITVSTLAEARAFAAHGFRDITYCVPIEPGKFDAAISLAREGVRLAVITDDVAIPGPLAAQVRAGAQALDVWVKVDCGYHRCGVDPESDTLGELVRRIGDKQSSGLRFAGLLTHAGHSYHAKGREAVAAVASTERDVMVRAASRLRGLGIDVPALSVGSTPTVTHVDHLDGIDEVRAGNYVFFDGTQAAIGSCGTEDCALTVLTSVVHRDRARRHVVLDAGAIALSKDRGATDLGDAPGYGRLLSLDGQDLGVRVTSLSQEHGTVAIDDDALLDRLPVGARVRVLANHSCLTAAQHESYHLLEGQRVVGQWSILRGW